MKDLLGFLAHMKPNVLIVFTENVHCKTFFSKIMASFLCKFYVSLKI